MFKINIIIIFCFSFPKLLQSMEVMTIGIFTVL